MKKTDFDLIVIGLGPAGMAVAAMGAEMGLKVCAIEKHKIGGECMNVGCIPSKSLLSMAAARYAVDQLSAMELENIALPQVKEPFKKIQQYLDYIGEKKLSGMFDKVETHINEGEAHFINSHTVQLGDKQYTAKNIFIATGTHPMVPPIKGIQDVEYLTNETIFNLQSIPKSLIIIGGGAIGSEMAQAFSRLGAKCSIVQMDTHLVPLGDPDAAELLESVFEKEGIAVYNNRKIMSVEKENNAIVLTTDKDEKIVAEKLLVAAGRRIDVSALKPEKAGIKLTERGIITVNQFLQTSQKNIYAVGDCNGQMLFSHAAMHQGMLALMNAVSIKPFKFNFKNYVTPWTVFTDPQFSQVGLTEKELQAKNISYETIRVKYENYGAAIAENLATGFVKAFVNKWGRVYGAVIIGAGSGEMINEWALIVQQKIKLHRILFLQHSFPTMGFLSKRIAEVWMMKKMKSNRLKRLCQFLFRL